jgi:dCTP deaminase
MDARGRRRMGILSDRDILARRAAGDLGIEPFDERCLTPNGYDLRVAEVMLPDVGPAAVHREGKVVVPPGERFLVSTVERVRMPADVTAQLWIRSSFARRGVFGAFGKIEAGFEGTLTVGGLNTAKQPLDLPIGERFCQVVFERMESAPRKLYAERSGNYQGQSGITLARDEGEKR